MEPDEALKSMMQTFEGTQQDEETKEETNEEPQEQEQEEVKEEPPVEEPPADEPPTEEPAEEVTEDLAADNARLRTMLNDLAKRVGAERATPPIAKRPEEEAARSAAIKEATTIIQDFITDEEADLLIDKPKEVMTKVLTRMAQGLRETMLRDLPDTVGQIAQQHISIYRRVDEFYKKNKYLDKYRDFVQWVGVNLEKENPDWDVDKIYDETAKVARAQLGLKAEMEQKESAQKAEPPRKPAMPSGRSSRKPSSNVKLSSEQEAMVGMLSAADL